MKGSCQAKEQPFPGYSDQRPASSPASSTPRFAALGLDPDLGSEARLLVPLMPGCVPCPGNNVRLYRDSRRLPLAVTAAVQAESSVCLIFVSQGWGSPQYFLVT
jgi:hypothetical protein